MFDLLKLNNTCRLRLLGWFKGIPADTSNSSVFSISKRSTGLGYAYTCTMIIVQFKQ